MAGMSTVGKALAEFIAPLVKSGDPDIAKKVAQKAAEIGASDAETKAALQGKLVSQFEGESATQRPTPGTRSPEQLSRLQKLRETGLVPKPGVESGKELVPVGSNVPAISQRGSRAPDDIIDVEATPLGLPPSPGTALVPTGRGKTTFIAGERGIGAGTPKPEDAARTVEERIKAGVQRDEYVSQPQSTEATSGSKGKVAAGVGGVAAAGTVAAALAGRKDSEEKAPTTASIVGEIPTSGPFKGKIAPTGAERAASRNIPYDYYDALNKEADKRIEQQKAAYKQSGLSTLPSEREAQIRQEVLDEARKKLSPEDEKAAADGLESIGNMIDVVPGGGETAKNQEVKRAPTPPTAPTPKGVDGTKPPVTKPVTSGKESQVTATQALKSTGVLLAKVEKGASNKVSKPTLDELTKTLDDVEATVSADARFKNTPVERDLVAARAEAYKMYKEKADRNQLLGTVERAINAIAQFASAQAGFGTRQAGGNLPLSSADYGGQTEQAFKEYQTEVGLLGEEQKAGERASDRKELLKEKEIGRRQKTIQEQIETERNALREAAAEKRAGIAAGGSANAEARRETRDIRTGKLADVKDRASNLSKQIETIQSAIKLGNRIGTGKSQDQDKEVAEFASAINQLPEDLQTEMDVGGKTLNPLTWGNPSTRARSKQVLSTYMKGLQQDLARLRQEQSAVQAEASSLRQGLGLSTTPVPAGQAAASSGKLEGLPAGTVIEQEGIKYRWDGTKLLPI